MDNEHLSENNSNTLLEEKYNETTDSTNNVETNVENQTDINKCKYCEKILSNEKSLNRHQKQHEKKINEKNLKDSNSDANLFECKLCGQLFRYSTGLQKHLARHENKGFICQTCGESFSNPDLREKHREKVHKIWKCFLCNIRFNKEVQYLLHIETLHEGRNQEQAICNACGKQFKNKAALAPHLASKCGTVKRFKCNECGQMLMTAGALFNHRLRHTGKRSHMCRFCAKTFLTAGQLVVHERIHTQEKVFVCDVCNKGFCHRQTLITHLSVHTGIKPYTCEGCSSDFSCIGNLLKHRKTHADTCGIFPLTTTSVKNPNTKLRLQANIKTGIKIRKNKNKEIISNILSECKDNPNMVLDDLPDKTEKDDLLNYFPDKQNSESDFVKSSNDSDDCGVLKIESTSDDLVNNKTDTDEENLFIKKENISNLESREYYVEDCDNENSKNCLQKKIKLKIPVRNIITSDSITNNNTVKLRSSNEKHKNNIIVNVKEEDFENIKEETDEIKENVSLDDVKSENDDNFGYDYDWSLQENKTDDSDSDDSVDLKTRLKKSRDKKKKCKRKMDTSKSSEFVEERLTGDGKTMACKICGQVYGSLRWLMRHEESHNSENKQYKYTCCNERFEKRKDFINHQKQVHKDQLGDGKNLACKICGQVYGSLRWLMRHEESHNSISKHYKCTCCNEKFENRKECINHQKEMHKDQLECPICHKVFSNIDSKQTHINCNHYGMPRKTYKYICDKCGKTFYLKQGLAVHEMSNCGESGKLYNCEICDRKFSSVYSRKAHMKLHEGNKPLLCKFCGKGFVWKGQLKIHERGHTGEKPYQCQFCTKSFAYRESLITHNSMHTGIKPYICSGCGSRFSCVGNMLKHKRARASSCGLIKDNQVGSRIFHGHVNTEGVHLKKRDIMLRIQQATQMNHNNVENVAV